MKLLLFLLLLSLVAFADTGNMEITVVDEVPVIHSAHAAPPVLINGSSTKLFLNTQDASSTWVVVTHPNSFTEEIVLTNKKTTFSNTSLLGRYNVTFYANNSLGIVVTEKDYFETFFPINYNFSVVDNLLTGINSSWAVYNRGTEIINNSISTGNYSELLPNTKLDLKVKAHSDKLSILLKQVNVSLCNNVSIGMDKRSNPVPGFLVTYGINYNCGFDNATLRVYYDNVVASGDLTLYKCNDWNFTRQSCGGSWVDITGNTTHNESFSYFDYNTTSFSGFSVKDAFCGNNVRDASEACDGNDLGAQSCSSLGYSSGSLSCSASCSFVTTACASKNNGGGSGGSSGGSGSGASSGGGGPSLVEGVDYSVTHFYTPGEVEQLLETAIIIRSFGYEVDYIYYRTSTILSTRILLGSNETVMLFDLIPIEFERFANGVNITTIPPSNIQILSENPMNVSITFLEPSNEVFFNYSIKTEKSLYLMEKLITEIGMPTIFILEKKEPIHKIKGKASIVEIITHPNEIELTPAQVTQLKSELWLIMVELFILIIMLLAIFLHRRWCIKKTSKAPKTLKQALDELEDIAKEEFNIVKKKGRRKHKSK